MTKKRVQKHCSRILPLLVLPIMCILLLSVTALANEISYDFQHDPEAYREYQRQKEKLPLSSSSSDDYVHNERFQDYTILKGIDVSKYQQTIDWDKVKADGYDYAIIRVGYRSYGSGELFEDSTYKQNIEGAIAAGVDVGIYIFSQAITIEEAQEEAQYAINLAAGYQLNLPVVMDFEYASTASGEGGRLKKANLTKEEATDICNAFCKTAEAMGYTAMVYANRQMLNNSVNAAEIANKYPIWLANYTKQTSYEGEYSYWQYTSTASVSGIKGNVDCNFRYIKKPEKPVSIKQTDCSYTDNTIRWSKVPGAYGYQVYRSQGGSYERIATIVGPANISHFDYDLTPGVNYQYKVRAIYKLYDKNWYGKFSDVLEAPTPTLSVSKLKVKKTSIDSISISWTGNPEANGYAIYRSTDGKKYKLVTELSASTTSYKDIGLKSGKVYYYQVRSGVFGSDASIIYASEESAVITIAVTKTKPIKTIKFSNRTKNNVKLTWSKTSGASGYQIYRSTKKSSGYKKIATIIGGSKKTYTDKTLKPGTTYYYKIRGYKTFNGTDYTGEFSEIKVTTSLPDKLTKINSKAYKNKIKLTWKKVSKATGYIIYRYDTKTKKYKQLVMTNKLSYVDRKLSKNKNYTYKIVAYKQLDGKIYKSDATVIKVKTTKR